MALSAEHTQTLETLAEHEHSRAVIETARFLLESEDTDLLVRDSRANRMVQRMWELERHEKLAINLTKSALILAIVHDHIPLEFPGYPDKQVFQYPRVSFAVGINPGNEDLPPINARVFAANHYNQPVSTRGEEFSIDAFEQILDHSIAELGLYSHIRTLSHAA